MACIVDWRLILEFTKALATPIASLLGLLIVAIQARRTYLKQKTVDKRLEWYEKMHITLDQLSKSYLALEGTAKAKLPLEEVGKRIDSLGVEFTNEADKAWLYAGRVGFHAVQQLNARLADLHIKGLVEGFSSQGIAELLDAVHETSMILSADLRRELGMESLHPSEQIAAKMKAYNRLRSGN